MTQTTTEYAPVGYHFARVSTPGVFAEFLLPENPELMNTDQAEAWQWLQGMAERFRTPIYYRSYRHG